jgi:phosphotransferase system enzyme I (PtsI)
MVMCDGIGAAPGIVIGPLFPIAPGTLQVPRYEIVASARAAEAARFGAAVERSLEQIAILKNEIEAKGGAIAEDIGGLLDAHSQMLTGSRLVRGIAERVEAGINAEAAVEDGVAEIAEQYRAITNSYLAGRIDDIHEVGTRLIRNLVKAPEANLETRHGGVPKGSIIVASEISPADAALMDPQRVGGFAATLGGAEGHTAIMARSLGIPAVLGIAGLLGHARRGDLAILDGTGGRIIFNPSEAQVAEYTRRHEEHLEREGQLAQLKELPAISRDGVRITLSANTELPVEIELANRHGAEGIGLVRTEFMFMNREVLPSEDEQFEELADIVRGMRGKSVTIRTLDIGGEKFSDAFEGVYGDDSDNPALGLRAIRFSLRHTDLFETQVAAILRAGALGPIRILLPMISNVTEVKVVRRLIDQVRARLVKEGRLADKGLPPIGVMIEVPAAALSADALTSVADFFSIGTNDLTMYTLAIDRANDQVATLYDPLHPAVLRLIQFTVNAAAAAGLPVNVCGEMAGDERIVPLLLGLGLRELSMNASALPRVKGRIRSLDVRAAKRCAETIMVQSDRSRIAAILADFNEMAAQ